MCRDWCLIFLLSVVSIIINSANIQSANAGGLGWSSNRDADASSEGSTTPLLSKQATGSTDTDSKPKETENIFSKPARSKAGYPRAPANADGNGERKEGNKEEPSEKTPLLSKESLDSTGSTDTFSRAKLARLKGSSKRTFRPPPEFQQDSTASKPELPKPELPKPELPKPELPEPELSKSKAPKPKLPMSKLPNKEIAATSMVDRGPDVSSEGSETGEKTPEEIEKELQKQYQLECREECWKSDGYIEVPESVVGEGDRKTHFRTGRTTYRGKGMRPYCDCVINSALIWFLNEREKGKEKGNAFEQMYIRDPKWAAEFLKKEGFEVHYYPAKPTKLQRSPIVKGIRDEEEKPPTAPGNEGCQEKCQRENGYINNGTGTVYIAIGAIDDRGFREICRCRANSGLSPIYLDKDEFSKFQSVFETNPQDIHTWSNWLLKKRLTVHWDSQKSQEAPQGGQKGPQGGQKGPQGGLKGPQGGLKGYTGV
ncbi:unnamed protein product [Bemisia tabaci]|uniref:Uncharacterized protein n=1 Tax=Bemisia tabaci TaxID=7038 RepID=A0A9P0F0X1_BEMTA|nr:unnamed protein product [Bemisia tabaci]